MSIDLGAGVRQYDVAVIKWVWYPAFMPPIWAMACLVTSIVFGAERGFDYHKPEFWSKTYRVTKYGAAYRVEFSVAESPEKALARVTAWMRARGGRTEDGMRWELAQPLTPAFLRKLMEDLPVKSLQAIETKDEALFGDREMLRYKRDRLREEQPKLEPARDFPALHGLTEAQLLTVDALLASIESAEKTSLLETAFVDPGSGARVAVEPNESRGRPTVTVGDDYEVVKADARSVSVRLKNPPGEVRYWSRTSPVSHCGVNPPSIEISFRAEKLADAHRRLRQWADEHGQERVTDECGSAASAQISDTQIVAASFVLADKHKDALKRRVISLGGLLGWRSTTADENNAFHAQASEKITRLRADLSQDKSHLAPHIWALAEAEVARLTPYLDKLEQWRGRSIVTVRIVWDRGGHP